MIYLNNYTTAYTCKKPPPSYGLIEEPTEALNYIISKPGMSSTEITTSQNEQKKL